MADDEPFQSWEARADEEFAAATEKNYKEGQIECCINLQQDDRSSSLNQHFPPSIQQKSPLTPQSYASPSSGSEYVPTPKPKNQKSKKSSKLPLHKQKKMSKAAKREANALSRLSNSSTPIVSHDPDEYQWNLLMRDQKLREAAAKKQNFEESVAPTDNNTANV